MHASIYLASYIWDVFNIRRGLFLNVSHGVLTLTVFFFTRYGMRHEAREKRTMEGHRLRVGALAWSSPLLSSGSILERDIRSQEDQVSKLTSHKSEIRKESPSCSVLNDNFSIRETYPSQSQSPIIEHSDKR